MFKLYKLVVCLCLLVLIAPGATAADFGLFGFDVRAGVVLPSDWDTGYLVGGSANVGEIVDGLYLYPALNYSQAETTVAPFGSNVTLEVTSFALGAEVRYFPAGSPTAWYFGGGPYLNFLDREIVAGRVTVNISTEEVGLMGVAGYQFGSEGTGLLAEARYSVVSGYDTVQVLAGYSF